MMMPSTPVVELYGPDFTTIHQVPVTVVVQLPAPKLNVKRLVECLNFAAARDSATSGQTDSDEVWQTNACSAGTNCKFVHIAQPLSKFPGRAIHVHYIWQSLKSVSYRRQWGGKCEDAPFVTMVKLPDYSAEVKRYDEQRERSAARLLASGGNVEQHDKDEDERVAFAMMVDLIASVAPAMRIPATRLLKTAGSTEFLFRCQNEIQPDYELSPCPDYMCHNECRMGEECPNAHVINLDVSQGTPFVRRTLRHVKAASEATMVQNEGRVQNGLFGMTSGRSKPKVVDVESTIVEVHGNQMTAILNSSESPGGNTNSYSNGVSISKNNSTDPPSTGNQGGSSDEVPVGVADTETSSSPMQFNASTLATPSTGNSGTNSGGGSGDGGSGGDGTSGDGNSGDGNSGDGSSQCQPSSTTDDTETTEDTQSSNNNDDQST